MDSPRRHVINGMIHPVWLEPEMAKLLDQNGYRRDAAGDCYITETGTRITESQLLIHDLESLRRLIQARRAKPQQQ